MKRGSTVHFKGMIPEIIIIIIIIDCLLQANDANKKVWSMAY